MTEFDVRPLIRHLEQQIASVSKLLEVYEQQFEAVKAKDVQAVMNTVFSLQSEMSRREQLELDRARLLGMAADRLGVNAEDVTVQRLKDLCSDDAYDQLHGHAQALKHLLGEVERKHRLNRELIEQELQFVGFMLEAVGEPQRPGTYDKHGEKTAQPLNPSSSILDITG